MPTQEVSESVGVARVCVALTDVKDGLQREVPVTITLGTQSYPCKHACVYLPPEEENTFNGLYLSHWKI